MCTDYSALTVQFSFFYSDSLCVCVFMICVHCYAQVGCPVARNGSYLPTLDKLEQVLDSCNDAINTCGLVPGEDIFLILDCAAHETFDYVSKYMTCAFM